MHRLRQRRRQARGTRRARPRGGPRDGGRWTRRWRCPWRSTPERCAWPCNCRRGERGRGGRGEEAEYKCTCGRHLLTGSPANCITESNSNSTRVHPHGLLSRPWRRHTQPTRAPAMSHPSRAPRRRLESTLGGRVEVLEGSARGARAEAKGGRPEATRQAPVRCTRM